jgi:hypothetical protein
VGQEKANNLLKKYNSVRLAIKHGNSWKIFFLKKGLKILRYHFF